jgi:hypothetical protein
MNKPLFFISLLALAILSGRAAQAQADVCTQIRTQIKAQTGVLEKVDVSMLEKISANPECRFSAAEVYRAAYGDRPIPQRKVGERTDQAEKHHDDDD